MQVEVGRKGEGYVATPSPFMVAKGHSEAPPCVPLQQGMVTKRGDANGRAGRIFMVPDLQLERGAGNVLEHNHANKIHKSSLQSKFLLAKRGVKISQEHRETKQIQGTFFNTTFAPKKGRALMFQGH